MPASLKHQGLTKLLTESPEFVAQLVRRIFDLDVPLDDLEVMQSADTVREIKYTEHSADGTVIVRRKTEDGSREAFIVEVQLRVRKSKRKAWVLYCAGLYYRLNCPVTLVVIAGSEQVADWAAKPIDVGRGRMVLTPLVIRPSHIPAQLDLETARRLPELAVMAVITHGNEPGAEHLGRSALTVVRELMDQGHPRAEVYLDLILGFLSKAALETLEAEMNLSTDIRFSELAKRNFTDGEKNGQVKLLLKQLGLRFGELSEATLAHVKAAESEQLELWSERVLTAKTLDEVFKE